MNLLDWCLIGGVLVGSYISYRLGLIAILSHVLGVVGGLVTAAVLYPLPLWIWELWFEPNLWVNLAGFVVLFLVGGVLVSSVSLALRGLLEVLWLSWLDHLAGGAVGFVVLGALTAGGLLVAQEFPGLQTELLETSYLAESLPNTLRTGLRQVPWVFDRFLDDFSGT